MVTRLTVQSGNWSAAGTWVGGIIPGIGDIAQIETTHTLTLTDNRQCFGLLFNGPSQSSFFIMNAGTTLTFDDSIGAGFQASSHVGIFTANGTSLSRCVIKSAAAPPVNFWQGEPNDHRVRFVATFTDFVDYASIFRFAAETVWTTVATNCTFKRTSGAVIQFRLNDFTRYVNCTFDRTSIDVLSSPNKTFLDNTTFLNGSLFGTLNIGRALMVSRTHNGVANDYRIFSGAGTVGAIAALTDLQSSDRPISSENVTITPGTNTDNRNRFKWDVSGTVNNLTVNANVDELSGVLESTLQLQNIELIVRGTLTQSAAATISMGSTGRLINHAVGGLTYTLHCGSAVLKSALTDDFDVGNDVTLKPTLPDPGTVRTFSGKLTCDENISHDNLTIKSGATLVINAGVIHTITSTKLLQVNVGGKINWNGAIDNMVKLRRGGGTGTAQWRLKAERGTLFLDRQNIVSAAQPTANFGIQGIQEPVMSYFATGNRSQMAYMSMQNGVNFDWRIMQYDHTAGTWAGPFTFDIVNQAEGDGHKFPSIIHDATGRIHIFYDCHNEPMKHIVKTLGAINDSSVGAASWTQFATLGTIATYPNVARGSDGVLYLTYREEPGGFGDTIFRKSTDNGLTWSAPLTLTNVLGAGVHDSIALSYQFGIRVTGTNTLHLWGNWRTFAGVNWDPWYITSTDGGTTWKKADGTVLTLPITPSTIDKPSGQMRAACANLGDVFTDGRPFMMFVRYDTSPYSLWFTRFNGTVWTTPTDVFLNSNNTMPFATIPWPNQDTGKCSIDNNDNIYLVHFVSTVQPNSVTGEINGDLYLMLTTSQDKGLTWEHSILRKFAGTPIVLEPEYVNSKWISELLEMHIFWGGPPGYFVNPPIQAAKDFCHERLTLTSPHEPRQVVATYVDVQNSDAQWKEGGVTIWADESTDSGGNSNWRFNNTTVANTPATVLRLA